MPHREDVLNLAYEVGKKVMMYAKGDPARMMACAVAGAVIVVGTVIGYEVCSQGGRLLKRIK